MIDEDLSSDYTKYRGKCKELSEAAIADDPTLTLCRGWYHCPFWGEQQHWWTKREDGTIYDPSKDQFPSKGMGTYVEFDGYYECEQCGKKIEEKNMVPAGRYPCCSNKCAFALVGLSESTIEIKRYDSLRLRQNA